MPSQPFDAKQFIRAVLNKGWQWSENHPDRIVYPSNHEFFLRYDADSDRITISPELDAHLELVILTPAGKSKQFR